MAESKHLLKPDKCKDTINLSLEFSAKVLKNKKAGISRRIYMELIIVSVFK